MIYLDNSATTKPDADVLQTFNRVNETYYFNPASIHELGQKTEKLLEQARDQIKSLLKTDKHIIFTSGATESNNIAITGVARAKKAFGRTIITTKLEHPSVLETVRHLETEGFKVKYAKFYSDGTLDMEHFKSLLTSDVVLVTMMHVNNVMGAILPVEDIARELKNYPKIHFHVDAVQAFGKVAMVIDQIDSLSLSGHKFHGLKGQGLLVLTQMNTLDTILFGGGQEYNVRSGTVNVASNVALSKAMRLAIESFDSNRAMMYQLKQEIEAFVKVYPGIRVNSMSNGTPHVINISFVGVKGEVIVNAMATRGIMISTTSACSSKRAKFNEALTAIGIDDEAIEGSVRISLSKDNTIEDINGFKEAFKEVYKEVEEILKK